jgi:hypothetical protein
MPERGGELRGRHGKEIGDRMLVEPQPHGIDQHELADPVWAQSCEFSTEHPSHGMAYDMHRL